MKVPAYLVLLGLLAIVSCSNVVNLTDENFNSTISANKYVMVKFFAPWCGHCKTMAPEYEKLADWAKEINVVIGEVDATISAEVAQAYNVQGYPTIKFFIDGFEIDYKGQRTADGMYEWIKKVTQKVLWQVTQNQIDELKTSQNLVVYFGSNQQKRKTIELLNVADQSIDYFVSPSESEKLVLYPLGKQPIQFPANLEFSKDQIKQWVMMQTIPTVVPLSSKDYLDWVFYDETTMKDVIMLLKEDDVSEEGFKKFEQFCQKNKQTYKCCVVEPSHQVYGGVKNYLRAQGHSILALTRDALKEAYAYPNNITELTEQSWKTFIAEINEEKHKNLAGEENDKIEYTHVKVLTDANFTTFINEKEVVFAEFYTTTCPHCVAFAKNYDEIAQKVYANESLNYEIVAVDIKKNKKVAADLIITSFPTFMVFVSGHSVRFEGSRDYESIINFINTVKDSKPIAVGSVSQIPTPSVVIYDPAETTSIKLLPALFTRYPIYHIREGESLRVVLKEQTDQTYSGELQVQKISKWLFKKTDPIIVDLLSISIQNKLREALENKIPILGFIDIEQQLSASSKETLEKYCKQSQLVCGIAKKTEQNFPQFLSWVGIESDATSSLVYINTQSYDRYLFPKKIEQLSVESIKQFVADVQEGKIISTTDSKEETKQVETPQEQKPEEPKEQLNEEQQEEPKVEPKEETQELESKESDQTQSGEL